MRKVLMLLLLIPSIAMAASSVNVGNGLEFRTEIDSMQFYVSELGSGDYTRRIGAAKTIADVNGWQVSAGGGLATMVIDLPAADGYQAQSDTEMFPFLQVDASKGIFFTQVFYADSGFTTRRVKTSPVDPNAIVVRYDENDGSKLGVFAGIRIPIQ